MREQVRRAIETAQCVIVFWSKAAAQSHDAQREIHQTIQAWSSDRLVLASLDETPLPVGLRDLPAISIKDASDPGVRVLVQRAQALIGRTTVLARAAERVSPAPARQPPQPARRSRFNLTVAAALVAGLAVLAGTFVVWQAWPDRSRTFASTSPSLSTVMIVLVLGVAIGAGVVLAWAARSRQRLKRALPTPATTVMQPTPAESTGTPQVFVSYSRQDTRTVEELVRQIEQLGYPVWIDRQSTGSQRYAAPIVRAIRTSRLVALMCSRDAFASDHVIREVYVAGDYKKPFIAFQLDSAEFPDELLYFVSGFPRIPVAAIDSQQLRSEIARLITA